MNTSRKFSVRIALLALASAFALIAVPVLHAQFVMGTTTATAHASVTQATNRTTAVTISANTGAITTNTASLAAGASATFTVTNTKVAVGDVVVVSIRSGATNKETSVAVTTVANGSFQLTVHNQHASTAEVGAIIVNFAVVKAVLN
jgi:hypothetical protein